MKKLNIIALLMVIALISGLLTGCNASNKQSESKYKIYCLNMDITGVVAEAYTPVNINGTTEELAEEFLERLNGEPATATLRQAIPNGYNYSYSISEYTICVDLQGDFYSQTIVEQTLVIAAIVRTLVQIPDISDVNFTINSEPLVDTNGNTVRSLNADSFVENTGKKINDKKSTDIVLYFADAVDSTKLRKETVHVTYSNKSIDKIVMDKLIQGPSEGGGMKSTIPAGTKIINSSIIDKVCYINLNENFINNQDYTITEEVLLYSIVNSLCSLDDVDKVQITVNGDTTGNIRYNYALSNLYEMDESLVTTGEESTEVSTENIYTTEEAEMNQ